MKKLKYFPVVLMLGLVLILTSSTEPTGDKNDFKGKRGTHFRHGMHRGMHHGTNYQLFGTLTQEQKDQIAKIRAGQMKNALPVKNELNEKMAKLRSLTTGDNIDTKAAEKVLAEIEGLKTKLAKQMVRTRLDIRNVLTDEQKVMFDARRGMQGKDGKRRAMHGQAGQKRQMPYAGQGRQGMQRGQRMAMKGMKQGQGQGMKGSKGMGAGQHHGQAMKGHGKHGQRKGMQGQQDMSGMKDLTQEQKDKMKELRLQQMKTMTQYSNQLGEYNARLKTLTTGDDVKLKDVDKLIDKMGKVKLEMAKYRLSHRMDVRALLTDEQKVMFDMHAMKGRHEGRRML